MRICSVWQRRNGCQPAAPLSAFCLTRFLHANRYPPPDHVRGHASLENAMSSLERDGVHQAALGPGRVQAAIEFQRARLADIALKDLAVIADRLDGLQHPFVVEAQSRPEFAGRAEQA